MNNAVKVLIGIGIAAAGAFAAKKVYDKVTEKKYSDMKTSSQMDKEAASKSSYVDDDDDDGFYDTDSTTEETKTEEDKSVFDKIKAGAAKKVESILIWAAEHPTQIAGFGVIISFAFTVIGGFRKVRTVDRLERQNREILKTLDRMANKENPHDWMNVGYTTGYNACFDDTLSSIRECAADGTPFRFYDSDNSVLESIKVEVL